MPAGKRLNPKVFLKYIFVKIIFQLVSFVCPVFFLFYRIVVIFIILTRLIVNK